MTLILVLGRGMLFEMHQTYPCPPETYDSKCAVRRLTSFLPFFLSDRCWELARATDTFTIFHITYGVVPTVQRESRSHSQVDNFKDLLYVISKVPRLDTVSVIKR